MKGHFWATFKYFFSWGLLYGAVLGACIGTSFFPIMGTIAGVFSGAIAGVACGLMSGVIVNGIQARLFHENIDLERYSHFLARIIGVVTSVSAVTLMWAIAEVMIVDFSENQFFLAMLRVLSLPVFLLSGLSAAYIASHYPASMLHRLRHKGKRAETQTVIPPDREEIHRAFFNAINLPPRLANRIMIIVGILSYIVLFIAVVRQGPITGKDLPVLFLAGPIGVSAAIVIWGYCAFGNAMVLSFLKRIIYRDYLPNLSAHWYRISLTLISFALTWAMIWWTTIPGPIIAGIMAHSIYRTLALPDDSPEKAKRKEKNTLALDEEGDAEDDSLLIEEALMEAHKQ